MGAATTSALRFQGNHSLYGLALVQKAYSIRRQRAQTGQLGPFQSRPILICFHHLPASPVHRFPSTGPAHFLTNLTTASPHPQSPLQTGTLLKTTRDRMEVLATQYTRNLTTSQISSEKSTVLKLQFLYFCLLLWTALQKLRNLGTYKFSQRIWRIRAGNRCIYFDDFSSCTICVLEMGGRWIMCADPTQALIDAKDALRCVLLSESFRM